MKSAAILELNGYATLFCRMDTFTIKEYTILYRICKGKGNDKYGD